MGHQCSIFVGKSPENSRVAALSSVPGSRYPGNRQGRSQASAPLMMAHEEVLLTTREPLQRERSNCKYQQS